MNKRKIAVGIAAFSIVGCIGLMSVRAAEASVPIRTAEALSVVEQVYDVETEKLSVTDFGATANDGLDDYEAFAAAAEAAKTQNKTLYIPAGEFTLSRILNIDGIRMEGAGRAETILVSTNPEAGSINLNGDGVQIRQFTHRYETSVPRGNGAHEKNSITVKGATNFVIDHIHVDGASTAGIMIAYDSNGGLISDNTVENTGADGIHMTTGSHDITVQNNTVLGTGDDGIAVVSYGTSPEPVKNIVIRDNQIGNFSKARGISVVGGQNVRIEGNQVRDTMMAGIYIAVEGSYDTLNVNEIQVNNNTIDNTGIQRPENHPNILVYASQGSIDNVEFNDNMILNAVHRGIGVWGDGDINDITFTRNTLVDNTGVPTTFENGQIELIDNVGF